MYDFAFRDFRNDCPILRFFRFYDFTIRHFRNDCPMLRFFRFYDFAFRDFRNDCPILRFFRFYDFAFRDSYFAILRFNHNRTLLTLRRRKVHVYFLSRAHAFLPSLFSLFAFSHKRFKNEEGSCSFSFYLPCLVYLLPLTSALRTRKVHVYFLSPVHAFLPSLFGLFAFSPASALRTRKLHVYFLSPVHAFL